MSFKHRKPIFAEDGKIINPPKHWKEMVEIVRGTGDTFAFGVSAMDCLGVPYSHLGLKKKQEKYYWTEPDDDGNSRRVHPVAMPQRLFHVLYHTTPVRERLQGDAGMFLNFFVNELKKIPATDDGLPELSWQDRGAISAVDRDGNLRDIPETLEQAIREEELHGRVWSEYIIKSFYAPKLLRTVLYFTAPEHERSESLLSEEEQVGAVDIVFQETNRNLREKLLKRRDEKRQIIELSDQLFSAIISGEVADADDLVEFGKNTVS